MNKEAKETTLPGATLYEFHVFACGGGRAIYASLERHPDGTPVNKPFIVKNDEVDAYVPQWQLTWGAGASMITRKVVFPPVVGLL